MRKLLLLTDVIPCEEFPAGLFLKTLCRMLPPEVLSCYAVTHDTESAQLDSALTRIPLATERGPSLRPRGSSRPWLRDAASLAHTFLRVNPHIRRIIPRVVDHGIRHKVDAVWGLLEGRQLIALALPVARALGVPLLTQVLDPPINALTADYADRLTRKAVLGQFGDALRASESCAATSWAMAKEYQRSYGVKAIPVVPSIDGALAIPVRGEVNSDSYLTIGLAGQIYAEDAWSSLLNALEQVKWRVAGRQVVLRIMGSNCKLPFARGHMRIEFLGYRSQAATISTLSQVDILYCPYPFNYGQREVARLCFPSKLATYLAAGRPVLVHAPSYASPVKFAQETGAAMCCISQHPQAVIAKLETLATDATVRRRLAEQAARALIEKLSLVCLRQSFARFLNVHESELQLPKPVASNCQLSA